LNALEWRLDDQSGILGLTEVVATLGRAVFRHPRTTFIACHLANCTYDLSILGRMLDEHPNLYADIGARYAETATIPRRAAAFFAKYRDRLLYGTDMGFAREMYLTTFRILETADEHFYDFDRFDYHWPLYGLALDDDVLEKVYAATREGSSPGGDRDEPPARRRGPPPPGSVAAIRATGRLTGSGAAP
jgi:predicted TIM-barrel fold metal-dependent hydrolase